MCAHETECVWVYGCVRRRSSLQPQWEVECQEQRAIKEGILAGPFVTGRRVDKLVGAGRRLCRS